MANNHSVFTFLADGEEFRVIRTKVSNIRPYIINKPISQSGQLGINGTFFGSSDYSNPPEASDVVYPNGSCGAGISWSYDSNKTYPYNGDENEQRSRGTLVICTNNNTNKTIAEVISKKNVSEIEEYYEGLPVTIKAIIGGGDLAMGQSDDAWEEIFEAEDWDGLYHNWGGWWAKFVDYLKPNSSLRRTGIGINNEDGEWYAYLAVSLESVSLLNLKHLFEDLNCAHAIFLDGSDSVKIPMTMNHLHGEFRPA